MRQLIALTILSAYVVLPSQCYAQTPDSSKPHLYFTADTGFHASPAWEIRALPLESDGSSAMRPFPIFSYNWAIQAFDVSPTHRTVVVALQNSVFSTTTDLALNPKMELVHQPKGEGNRYFDAIACAHDDRVYVSERQAEQGPQYFTRVWRCTRSNGVWGHSELFSCASDNRLVRGLAVVPVDSKTDRLFISLDDSIKTMDVAADGNQDGVAVDFRPAELRGTGFGSIRATKLGARWVVAFPGRNAKSENCVFCFDAITANKIFEIVAGSDKPIRAIEAVPFAHRIFLEIGCSEITCEAGAYEYPKIEGDASFSGPPTIRVATPFTSSYIVPRMTIREASSKPESGGPHMAH